MAINKVIYGEEVLVDLTDSTVSPDNLADGEVAYNRAGERIVGTFNLDNYYTKTEIDNKGYLTEHQDISGKADKVSITAGKVGYDQDTTGASVSIPYFNVNSQGLVTSYGTRSFHVSGFATTDWVGQQGFLKSVPSTYALKTDIPSDSHINDLITAALGVIENGTY